MIAVLTISQILSFILIVQLIRKYSKIEDFADTVNREIEILKDRVFRRKE